MFGVRRHCAGASEAALCSPSIKQAGRTLRPTECPSEERHTPRIEKGMATFVPYASCYGNKQAVQLLGRNSYFSLFASPPCLAGQRQRLAKAPEMTLRQIAHLIRALRQLNLRDAKGNPLPDSPRSRSSSSSTESQQSRTSEQRCLSCFHPRRNSGPPCVG